MRRKSGRPRIAAVLGVAGLLGALLVVDAAATAARSALPAALTAAPAAATPVPPSASSCTYNGSPSAVTGVAAGTSVSIVCTGMPASATLAVAQASPLAGIADPASAGSGFADQTHIVIGSSDATGAFTATFIVHATGDATNPFTPSNGNADATCPPSGPQINAGLVGCALAIVNVATLAPVNTATIVFASSAAPAAPTLALSPNPAVRGDVINGSDAASPSGFWWGAPLTGAPNATFGVPGFTATVGGLAATNTLSATPAAYCVTGAVTALCTGKTGLVPPALSGTITVPTTVPAGPSAQVVVNEPNTTPVAGNGPGGTTVQGTATLNFSTQTLTATPVSACSPSLIALSGSGWDAQGSAVTAAFSTASAGHTVDTATLTVSPSGTVSGTIALTANEQAPTPPSEVFSNPIVGTQTAKGGQTLTAIAPFILGGCGGQCTTSGSPNNCSLQQFVTQSVAGDPQGLTLNEGATVPTVTMGPITLNGKVQTTQGSLAPVTLDDNRGTLVGWSLTAQFANDAFSCSGTGGAACPGAHPIDNTIPASNMLLVAPSVVCADPGNPATVPPTPPSCVISEVGQGAANKQVFGPSGAAASLGSAAAGGGGGSFLINSPVSLLVPPFIAAGTYQNTLNITVT